jgi:hypothetical protein
MEMMVHSRSHSARPWASMTSLARPAAAFGLVAAIAAGCAAPKDYGAGLNPMDTCAPERKPIAAAGNEVERRSFARAKQIADQRMVSENRRIQRTGGSSDILADIGDSLERDKLLREEYAKLQANPTGADAVQMLSLYQGEAANDRARLEGVAQTTKTLRECRARSIAQAQQELREARSLPVPNPTVETAARQNLQYQAEALRQDDSLINQIFGEYTTMADLFAANQSGGGRSLIVRASTPLRANPSESATTITTASKGVRVRTVGNSKNATPGWQMVDFGGKIGFIQTSLLTAPATASPLEKLAHEQASAASADRKSSDDMRQSLENALGT